MWFVGAKFSQPMGVRFWRSEIATHPPLWFAISERMGRPNFNLALRSGGPQLCASPGTRRKQDRLAVFFLGPFLRSKIVILREEIRSSNSFLNQAFPWQPCEHILFRQVFQGAPRKDHWFGGVVFSAFWAPFLRAKQFSSSWGVLFIVAQLPKGSLYFWEARVRPWGPWKKPTSTFQSLGVSFFSFLGFIFVSHKCVAKLGGSSHRGATPQRAPRFLGSLKCGPVRLRKRPA